MTDVPTRAPAALLAGLVLLAMPLAGCLGGDLDPQTGPATPADDQGGAAAQDDNATDPRLAHANGTGPAPPPGEDYTGLLSIEMVFGGSLRHPLTRVLLVPPTHGDLTNPTNTSRSGPAYLQATIAGIVAWELAVDAYLEDHPEFAYLDEITVQIELFDEDVVPEAAGYDIVVGYVETSGPLFRGVAFGGNTILDTQERLDDAGVGDVVHYGNRYILLSLFASAPRSGAQGDLDMDFPETHEVYGVTMHEFAHTFGLGHSDTWTVAYGPDLMNSPYPFVYGDGDPLGDGGERSPMDCISSLDLYGLAHLYRWLPAGEWAGSSGEVELPMDHRYELYCTHEEALEQAAAWMEARGLEAPLTDGFEAA